MDTAIFVDQIREIGLLFDRRLTKAVQELDARVPDGRSLARELIRRDLLTPFQANQILTGRGRELVLGRYRLQERLGHGSLGRVYKAAHVAMGRTVTVQLLPPAQAADPQVRLHFHREIQTLAGLCHPHIPAAFDAFELDGVPVLVMEYVEGVSLAHLAGDAGRLPFSLACLFLGQTARALEYAHGRGLDGTEILPKQIIITGLLGTAGGEPDSLLARAARGSVKVVGLGTVPPDSLRAAPPGTSLARADFAAPEQVAGVPGAVEPIIVYRLGCILYFALTARPPFADELQSESGTRQLAGLDAWETLRRDLPARLAEVVERMLAWDPCDRYQRLSEVAADLEAFGPPGAPPTATPQGPGAPDL